MERKSVGNGGDLSRRKKKKREGGLPREAIFQGSSLLVQVWPLIRQNCGKRETNHSRA